MSWNKKYFRKQQLLYFQIHYGGWSSAIEPQHSLFSFLLIY
jgi:hypothetical protein